ncbi:MAG: hypothetical protein IIZ28_04200 [Erysipelotrichaceae bacterium]|nr:hypothetical protein [Erysipelotrichaceae bacterium]MBQ1482755.1 hypothetical protein [Erysipelotrichaceae bacterium]
MNTKRKMISAIAAFAVLLVLIFGIRHFLNGSQNVQPAPEAEKTERLRLSDPREQGKQTA